MRVFELNRKQVMGDEAYPLKALHARIDIELDFGGLDVPAAAARRIALQALQDLLQDTEAGDLQVLSRPMHTASRAEVETDDGEQERDWEKPDDMDLRVVKSAHRVVQEVAKRGVSGRAVLAADLVGSIGLSAPTLGRLLRDGEQAHDYLSRYVRVTPHGRTKALDLTPEGRMLASKIRAGVVPS